MEMIGPRRIEKVKIEDIEARREARFDAVDHGLILWRIAYETVEEEKRVGYVFTDDSATLPNISVFNDLYAIVTIAKCGKKTVTDSSLPYAFDQSTIEDGWYDPNRGKPGYLQMMSTKTGRIYYQHARELWGDAIGAVYERCWK